MWNMKNRWTREVEMAGVGVLCVMFMVPVVCGEGMVTTGKRLDEPLTNVIRIAAGGEHCLALKADGSIVAWGENNFGECDVPSPNKDFTAIAAGYTHSLGLKKDGSIVAWGGNYHSETDAPVPNGGFVTIAAGGYRSLEITKNGVIVEGQIPVFRIGEGFSEQTPMFIEPNTVFVAVSTSDRHVLGLTSTGSITSLGSNGAGQRTLPVPNKGFVAVAAGGYHSLGLKADGSIVAWGQHACGQCDVPSPNTGFIAIAAGQVHSLGLMKDGSVIAWGAKCDSKGSWERDFGQCSVPSPNADFVAIAAGSYHSLGLKRDGTVVAWGKGFRAPDPNAGRESFLRMRQGNRRGS
jgi:alpha-tubulin suppressor-like RCC1 family protein